MAPTQALSRRFVGPRCGFGTLSALCCDRAPGRRRGAGGPSALRSRARRLDVGEAIADAVDVHDRPRAALGELAPQSAGVRVQRARAAGRAEAPDVAQQLVL